VQGWLAPDGFQLPKAALQVVRNLLIFQDEMMHKGPLKQCTATTGIVIWPKRHRAAIFGAEVACHMLMDALHGDTQALEGFVDEQDLRKDYVEAVSKESFEDWPGERAFGGLLFALADRWLPWQATADDFLEFLEQIKFGEQELSASTESLLVKVLAHFGPTTEVGRACTEVYNSKLLVSEQTAGICCNTLRFFCSSPLILAARKGKAFLEELAERFVTSLQHRPKESKEAEDHSALQIKTLTTLLSVLTSSLPSEQLLEQTCSAVVSNKTRYVRARLDVLIRTCARDVHESMRCAFLLNNVSFKQLTRLRQVRSGEGCGAALLRSLEQHGPEDRAIFASSGCGRSSFDDCLQWRPVCARDGASERVQQAHSKQDDWYFTRTPARARDTLAHTHT
jgi:hypothetical protein